jgi:hypothetical protein
MTTEQRSLPPGSGHQSSRKRPNATTKQSVNKTRLAGIILCSRRREQLEGDARRAPSLSPARVSRRPQAGRAEFAVREA